MDKTQPLILQIYMYIHIISFDVALSGKCFTSPFLPTFRVNQWLLRWPPGIVSIADGPWWRHQMETFSRYWPFVRGIYRSPVSSSHKGQWRGALVFYLCLNKWFNKHSWGWWFETPSHPLWRHCNALSDPDFNGVLWPLLQRWFN